jgi:hypothetical protein
MQSIKTVHSAANSILAFLCLSALCVNSIPCYGEEISQQEFTKLQESILPDAKAAWRTIPWKISLLDAQATAAKSQKPIFIWAMDGHPLGCT